LTPVAGVYSTVDVTAKPGFVSVQESKRLAFFKPHFLKFSFTVVQAEHLYISAIYSLRVQLNVEEINFTFTHIGVVFFS
jgi:hypothetical protein